MSHDQTSAPSPLSDAAKRKLVAVCLPATIKNIRQEMEKHPALKPYADAVAGRLEGANQLELALDAESARADAERERGIKAVADTITEACLAEMALEDKLSEANARIAQLEKERGERIKTKPFGLIIRDMRRQTDISQRRMGELIGSDFEGICAIENGRYLPKESELREMAPFLDAPADLLLLALNGSTLAQVEATREGNTDG